MQKEKPVSLLCHFGQNYILQSISELVMRNICIEGLLKQNSENQLGKDQIYKIDKSVK